MRHHDKNRKFGRKKNGRVAFLRGLVLSLIKKEKIKTTEARAKEIKSVVEKIITRGKTDTLANRRLLLSKLYNQNTAVKKVFEEISPRYKGRSGGYIRITKLAPRKSDGAKLAYIEFI